MSEGTVPSWNDILILVSKTNKSSFFLHLDINLGGYYGLKEAFCWIQQYSSWNEKQAKTSASF